MSTRRYVSQLSQQETFNEVFIASDKQLRTNRNGNYFLQFALSDRSGSISALLWNASDRDSKQQPFRTGVRGLCGPLG